MSMSQLGNFMIVHWPWHFYFGIHAFVAFEKMPIDVLEKRKFYYNFKCIASILE